MLFNSLCSGCSVFVFNNLRVNNRDGFMSHKWTTFRHTRNWNNVIAVAATNRLARVLCRHLVFAAASFAFNDRISHASPRMCNLSRTYVYGSVPRTTGVPSVLSRLLSSSLRSAQQFLVRCQSCRISRSGPTGLRRSLNLHSTMPDHRRERRCWR